jgi:hypothetical protein
MEVVDLCLNGGGDMGCVESLGNLGRVERLDEKRER